MKKIKVILCGAAGKMGRAIIDLIKEEEGLELVSGVEREEIIKERLVPGIQMTTNLEENIYNADVVIDFTEHSATIKYLKVAAAHKKPMVIGTTGHTQEEIALIKKEAQNIPIVYSPNMSISANVLFKVIEYLAKLIGRRCDVEIIEKHHIHKKDAPSGTAKKLARIIANERGIPEDALEQVLTYGRVGSSKRKPDEIGIFAIRAGDILGEHTVIFAQPGEIIEITHRINSRTAFAYGVILAVKFIVNKEKGLYSMEEVLNL